MLKQLAYVLMICVHVSTVLSRKRMQQRWWCQWKEQRNEVVGWRWCTLPWHARLGQTTWLLLRSRKNPSRSNNSGPVVFKCCPDYTLSYLQRCLKNECSSIGGVNEKNDEVEWFSGGGIHFCNTLVLVKLPGS